MSQKKKPAIRKQVDALVHEDAKRKNIPTAEYESVMAKEDQTPIELAYQRRNRDLDPQLVWRGKDEQDWHDLVVQAPPLYIQEKVHPKVLIDDLRRQTETAEAASDDQAHLFGDFNGLPTKEAQTEFFEHDAKWTNRMILGDSLQLMASLAEREGLRGQVQCPHLDPPCGIKFNSNFQWSRTFRHAFFAGGTLAPAFVGVPKGGGDGGCPRRSSPPLREAQRVEWVFRELRSMGV